MKNQLEQRLGELKTEYDSGQQALAEMEESQANMKGTMLRISGAMQVLEELLAAEQTKEGEQADSEKVTRMKETASS